MLLSGSLAKGTALESISDIDVACYISSESAPEKIVRPDRLARQEARRRPFRISSPSRSSRKTYSVARELHLGTGNEVDVVPILYDGDPEWRGNLVSQETGEKLMTSVPMHLEFIRKRKAANDKHFAQMVRLVKFWCELRKQRERGVPLQVVHGRADRRPSRRPRHSPLDDYPRALRQIFAFIGTTNSGPPSPSTTTTIRRPARSSNDPVRIWDPVNCENNVAKLYTPLQEDTIVEAALDAGDAVDSALRAITKGETVRYWQKVFGSDFNA